MTAQTMLKTLEKVIKPVILIVIHNLIQENWLIVG